MFDFLTGLALPKRGAVYLLSDPAPFAVQEAAYASVRTLEGRLYADDIVRQLPLVPAGHKHAGEWRMRAESAARIQKYVAAKAKPLTILDLGCGNGWMINHLTTLTGSEGLGMDVNLLELEQAARVFARNERVAFLYANVFDARIPTGVFDLIVLASSLQYFAQPSLLLARLGELLRPQGEIHILDTPFYEAAAVADARQRTLAYYQGQGVPEMAQFYHHHQMSDLAAFQPLTLYDPDGVPALLRRRLALFQRSRQTPSPFPWLLIRKDKIAEIADRTEKQAAM